MEIVCKIGNIRMIFFNLFEIIDKYSENFLKSPAFDDTKLFIMVKRNDIEMVQIIAHYLNYLRTKTDERSGDMLANAYLNFLESKDSIYSFFYRNDDDRPLSFIFIIYRADFNIYYELDQIDFPMRAVIGDFLHFLKKYKKGFDYNDYLLEEIYLEWKDVLLKNKVFVRFISDKNKKKNE